MLEDSEHLIDRRGREPDLLVQLLARTRLLLPPELVDHGVRRRELVRRHARVQEQPLEQATVADPGDDVVRPQAEEPQRVQRDREHLRVGQDVLLAEDVHVPLEVLAQATRCVRS